MTFKVFVQIPGPFLSALKSAHLERQPDEMTITPYFMGRTQEAEEQKGSLSSDADAMETESAFQGLPQDGHTCLELERVVHADSRAFCTALQTCREGTQKIPVTSLVRENEKENLRENNRDLAFYQMHPHFSASFPTPESTGGLCYVPPPPLSFPTMPLLLKISSAPSPKLETQKHPESNLSFSYERDIISAHESYRVCVKAHFR